MPTPAFPENQEKRAPGVHSGRRRRGLVEPEIYSGGGPQEQPPSLDEPVGGKLIRFLYCRRNRESFQFLMDFWYKKVPLIIHTTGKKFMRSMVASFQILGCRASAAFSRLR